MFLEQYDVLKDDMIQILSPTGEVVKEDWLPKLEDQTLLDMYKTMVFGRVIDEKVLQFQRQGRILTYAPNLGQEAAQAGSAYAMEQTDWVASAFRELGVWLRKGAPLYEILLYWYGNEQGMHMPKEVRVLPINVPIASQFQHATGLAYATMYRDEKDVTIAYVGDGGTSQGDFHEALNFAAVNQTPNVFIIQNNQYAISTKRKRQTAVGNLAQKALAYGMPGIQVDGNDALAMYAVTKEAIDRARAGQGPTLIEAYTYRMGAHTTSDDPTIYRDQEEVDEWQKKDPILRMFNYLKNKELWDEDKDEAFKKERETFVKDTFKKVENSGLVPIEEVFGHIYETMPTGLKEQMEKRNKEAK